MSGGEGREKRPERLQELYDRRSRLSQLWTTDDDERVAAITAFEREERRLARAMHAPSPNAPGTGEAADRT